MKIQVQGRVQGVFFREQARQTATTLGLTGWVRNESDGSVKIVAEGPEDKLQELIQWCKNGPRGAGVENVEVKLEKTTEEFKSFEIQ